MKHHRPARGLVAASALVLAAAVTGCSSPEETAPTTAPAVDPTADPEIDDPQSSLGEADAELLAAADNALAEIERGTVFAVEREDDGWEVSVIDQDGTTNVIGVSADGSTVTSGPTAEDDDTQERTEQRAFVRSISVDHAEALASAREAGVDGAVDAVDLDETDGITTWSVTVASGTADERTAIVDAGTGEVLRVEQDD